MTTQPTSSTPTRPHAPSDLPFYIAEKIDVNTAGHWIWEGNYHPDGLPLIGSKMAHSAIYKYLTPLPKHAGRIFRTCGVKRCVNPAHMRCPTVENGGLSGRVPKAEKTQGVEEARPNSDELVKVLQRIAEVLERIEVKVK